MPDMSRGRLNRIELLPESCRDLIEWAARELAKRTRTQTEILEEFNCQLKIIDPSILPISASGFNRYAIRMATMAARMKETREIAGALAGQFDADASDNLTIIAAEAIKTLIYETLTAAGTAGMEAKDAGRLAGALRSAAMAQQISSRRRDQIKAETRDKALGAVESVAQSGTLSPDVLNKIKSEIYGLFDDKKSGH